MTKQRDSSFELLRIVAILLVLVLHADFLSLEGPYPFEIVRKPADSFLRILFQTTSVVCVDVFVMISGWFGIRPSLKSSCNLIFQVFFYLILLYALALATGHASISIADFKHLLLASPSNWFIKSYICLYIFAPVLNFFVEYASRKQYQNILVAFYTFQLLYGWIFPTSTGYIHGGYSPISFMGLYLLAQYVRVYKPTWSQWSIRNDVLCYVVIAVGVALICFVPSVIGIMPNAVYGYNLLTYISPTTIAMSLLMIIMASKIHFTSKVVNWLAQSSFAVYLVYVSPWVLPLYRDFFKGLYTSHQGLFYWGQVLPIVLCLFLAVVVVDQLRKGFYSIIQKIIIK